MKLLPVFISGFFLGSFVLTACDKIENPIDLVDEGPDTTGISHQFNDTTWNDTIGNFKRIVLEDYTGHTCGNCPAASIAAENLHNQYGDTLLVAAIHAGGFAAPDADYPADYRTEAGTDYDNFFKVSTLGNPNGLINRRGYTAQDPAQSVVPYPSWGTKLSELTSDPSYMNSPVKLKVRNIYNTEKRINSINVQGEVQLSLTGSYEMVAWVLESGIVSSQKDYSKPAGQQKVTDYVHNHVLRKSYPGTWGDAVITGQATAGDKFEKTFSFEMDNEWNVANSEILIVLYDVSNREIIQAAKVKIGS